MAGTTAGTFAEGNHTHELDELDASGISSGKVLTANGSNAASWEDPIVSSLEWSAITNKPSTFPPSSHTHPLSALTQSGAQTDDIIVWDGGWAPQSPATWIGNNIGASDIGAASSGAITASGLTSTGGGKIVGRTTAGTGALQEITVSSPLTLSGTNLALLSGSIPSASSATPAALGVAAAGSSSNYSRADHVHAIPTPSGIGATEEAPEDGIIYGRKDADWVDVTSPSNLQVRRGTEAEVDAIVPLEGEPVWETDTKTLKIGDGVTFGGISAANFPLEGTVTSFTESGVIEGVEYFLGVELGKIQINEDLELRGYDVDLDFTHVAGNSRGAGAIDLQMMRSAGGQVASALRSVLIGGLENTASGNESVCISGQNNIASGLRAVCIGGSNSVASGQGATTITGMGSGTAAGVNSIVLGAGGTTSSGATDSVAVSGATTDRAFSFAKKLGTSVFSGRGQSIEIGLRAKTTSATVTQMTLNGSDKLTIPSGVSLFGTMEICAIEETNATEAAHYIRKFAIQNLAGTTSLIGTVTTVGTDYESDAGYDVAITADNTGDFLKVEVTGDSAKTLRWLALVRGVEISI